MSARRRGRTALAFDSEPVGRAAPARVRGIPEVEQATPIGWVSSSRGRGLVSINHGSTFLVASADGDMRAAEGHGLYSDDTRFLARHELGLNGKPLTCLATTRLSFRRARWTLVPTELVALDGRPLRASLTVTVDHAIGARRLHEDLVVRCYGEEPVAVLLTLTLESDFADLFEVRTRRWQRRSSVTTVWSTSARRLDTRYRRDGFDRRCLVRFMPRTRRASYANGQLRFPIDLNPGGEWRICIQYDLITASRMRPTLQPCPVDGRPVDRATRLQQRWRGTVARARPADARLRAAFDQAVEDFAALRLYDLDFSPDVWLPAAGVPWFVAVFGRDSILASLQALPIHPLFAIGTLQKLAQWQAREDDPQRDAEPGKICHEMRVGEWARFGVIPHSPYYGTADATPLYLLLLAEAYRWLGNSELLYHFRGTALRCLDWIDHYGDRDGDGLQEFAPRSAHGYRNQCWRDAEDGVLDENGGFPPHPIGTCDLDAHVYAAKLGVAELFEAWGDIELATTLRRQAQRLRRRFLDAYWLDDEQLLAFALDGDKRRVRTATSLPGHCLWLGILDQRRGNLVADRLMQPDLFAGWGLRTLSSSHPAYDPYSYQRGSVWPHDSMIGAAGLCRYGRFEDAWRLMDGLLAAVASFDRTQMPELFAGLPRGELDAPVPYEAANVPQAWSAGVIFQAVRVLLGLEPDVPQGRLYVDPVLPPWCPELRLENVRIGAQRFTFAASRLPDGSSGIDVESSPGALAVVRGRPPRLRLPAE